MNEFEQLLRDLIALEPDRFRCSQDQTNETFGLWRDGCYTVIWALNLGAISQLGLNYLQAGIQDAILARGWLLRLENSQVGTFYVQVFANGSAYHSENRKAAIALTAAYVAGLKGAEGAIEQGGEG